MAVDSICDPLFAAEMAHAREVWLTAQEMLLLEVRERGPALVRTPAGDLAYGTERTTLARYADTVQALYFSGLTRLGTPGKGGVRAAFEDFQRVTNEHQQFFLLAVRLTGETDLEKLQRHAFATVQERK